MRSLAQCRSCFAARDMGIGAESAVYRRLLFRVFASKYFRRRSHTPDGSFEVFVSPGSALKVLDPRRPLVDETHARFIRRWVRPSDIVWDIGANNGLFAFPVALKARRGRVYAFEPDIDLARHLLRSARLRSNAGLQISVICAALGDDDGSASFEISKFSRAMSRIAGFGSWNSFAADESRIVAQLRIDTLAKKLAPPDILKIDVEGAEIAVLRGGAATIAARRPTILIEGPEELSSAMASFFNEQRYVMLDGDADGESPIDRPVWNTIAVPGEKLIDFAPMKLVR